MTSKEIQQFLGRLCIEHVAGTQPAFTRNAYTVTHLIQSVDGMCIWINGNLDALVSGTMQVTPIQIQAQWACIDLYANTMRGSGINYRVYIQRIAFPAKQYAPGRMPDDITVRFGDSTHHASCLLLLREIEQAVNRGDYEIEGCQHIISVIERAVAQDIALCSFEDT